MCISVHRLGVHTGMLRRRGQVQGIERLDSLKKNLCMGGLCPRGFKLMGVKGG